MDQPIQPVTIITVHAGSIYDDNKTTLANADSTKGIDYGFIISTFVLTVVILELILILSIIIYRVWPETRPNAPCPGCASSTSPAGKSQAQKLTSLTHRSEKCVSQATKENWSSKSHRLPAELVDLVMGLLSPLSLRCLKITCRRFYYHPYHTSSLSSPERFELLCFLERDQPSLERVVCGSCRSDHDRSQFFPTELQKDPFHR